MRLINNVCDFIRLETNCKTSILTIRAKSDILVERLHPCK